jgi:hypothetical protein
MGCGKLSAVRLGNRRGMKREFIHAIVNIPGGE